MKTVVVKPEFAGLTEEQVIDAIDAYEAQVDEYYANKGVADAATTKGAAMTAMATSSPPTIPSCWKWNA